MRLESFGSRPSGQYRKEGCAIREYKKSPTRREAGYYSLWVAVIQQAVKDYKCEPNMRAEISRFFRSKYFQNMSDCDGQKILDCLKSETRQKK